MSEKPPTHPDSLRRVELTRIGQGRFKATNGRGGLVPIASKGDPDFTPVELLLAAIAGCSALDVDAITRKRSEPLSFDVAMEGHKVRDEQGNHMTGLRMTLDVRFPEGEAGDAAREFLPRAIAQSRDRLCTVSRTVQLGEEVLYEEGDLSGP
jgi:putative redox protein